MDAIPITEPVDPVLTEIGDCAACDTVLYEQEARITNPDDKQYHLDCYDG